METVTPNVRSHRGADIDSDHHLVIAEVQMKVARVKHNHDSSTRKMDYQKLHDHDTKDHKIKTKKAWMSQNSWELIK
jgi:hypothetical protein